MLELGIFEIQGFHSFQHYNISKFHIHVLACFVVSQGAHVGPRAQHGPHVPYGDSHVLKFEVSALIIFNGFVFNDTL